MTRKRWKAWTWNETGRRGQRRARPGGGGGSQADPLDERVDCLLELGILLDQGLQFGDGVEDGSMVLPAEGTADIAQRGVGELAGEIHGDLPWEGHGLGAILRPHVRELDAEDLGDFSLNVLDRDDLLFLAPEVGEHVLGELHAHLPTRQRAEGDHTGQGALDLADVRLDPARDQIGDVVGQADSLRLRFLLENGYPRLEVGGLDIGDQAPLEAGAQALLELGNLLRRGIRGDHDLLPRLVEIVEGMEELLLRSFLTGNELDVVDEKEIDGPVLGAEFRRPIIADGIDEIIGEALGGEIERAELRVELGDLMSDRVKQVRLPQADAAVDEERVVRAGGQLGHGLAGRLSE